MMRANGFLLVLIAGCLLAVGCLPQPAEPLPEPSKTPIPPTLTPSPTPVWFPVTATPTMLPTRIVSPTLDLSPDKGELLWSDDFSDPKAWALGRTGSTSIALGKQELTLAMDNPGAYLSTLRQNTLLGDFYLEITASPSLCRGPDEYGVLLRVSEASEFYRFSLSCNGEVRLDKYFNGKASSPHPPELSGAVPPGSPSSVRIGVWARGRELRFYAGGEYQFSLLDASLPSGGIGLFIRSNTDTPLTVTFSDLRVYYIK